MSKDTDRIVRSIEIAAPIERVWAAIGDHRRFGAWFRAAIDGPFVPGQPSRGRMTEPGYEHFPWEAEIVAVEPPHRLAFRWHPGAVAPDEVADDPMTLVEFRLEPVAQGTRVTVIESGFDALPPHRRGPARQDNDGGWAIQVERVRAYVEQDGAV